MTIDTVLETVFLKNNQTIAHILKNDIVVQIWHNNFYNKKECFNYINEYMKGIIQSHDSFKKAEKEGYKTAIKTDPLLPYHELYDELIKYAKDKFGEDFNYE